MTNPDVCPTDLPSWKHLAVHAAQIKSQHLKDLFAADDKRFTKFSLQLPHLLFDYSKNVITDETKAALLALAKESNVESWRGKMFAAETQVVLAPSGCYCEELAWEALRAL